jgi:hypothetical protein
MTFVCNLPLWYLLGHSQTSKDFKDKMRHSLGPVYLAKWSGLTDAGQN